MTTEGIESYTPRVHNHLTAELLLTSDCNMACSYCIARGLPHATLNIEDGQKAIDLFIRLGDGASSVEITLTGGEPLLVFPLAERLICYAEERTRAAGMDVSFVLKTNGTILNDVIMDFIRVHRLKVVVSIDGPASVHDKHRLTKQHYPTHSAVLRNLTSLLEHNVHCVASVTVHPDTCATVFDNVRRLHEIGIEHIDIGPVYGTVGWSEPNIDALVDSFLYSGRYMRQVRSAGGQLEIGPLYRSTEHVGGVLKDNWGCHAASTNLAFMPTGQIVGCSSLAMLSARYPELIIGDIVGGVHVDALDKFLELAQAGLEQRPHCQHCGTAPNCTGGCLAINLSQNGAPFIPPHFYCRTISIIPVAWRCAWGDQTYCSALPSGHKRKAPTPHMMD
jgi:uncharacterized protein